MGTNGNSKEARGLGCEAKIEQIKIYLAIRRVEEHWESRQLLVELE